jgi:hypothetical protein
MHESMSVCNEVLVDGWSLTALSLSLSLSLSLIKLINVDDYPKWPLTKSSHHQKGFYTYIHSELWKKKAELFAANVCFASWCNYTLLCLQKLLRRVLPKLPTKK